MAKGNKRFTIYDVMEARGDFEANSANANSPNYKRELYPKMFYHPKGETRQTKAPEIIVTPLGPKEVNAQYEMIYQVAGNKAEADELRKQGWHDHPAKAIAASGGKAPAMSPDGQIASLEQQIAELQAQLAQTKEGAALAEAPPGGRLTAKVSQPTN